MNRLVFALVALLALSGCSIRNSATTKIQRIQCR